jgi:hypothetical protein
MNLVDWKVTRIIIKNIILLKINIQYGILYKYLYKYSDDNILDQFESTYKFVSMRIW